MSALRLGFGSTLREPLVTIAHNAHPLSRPHPQIPDNDVYLPDSNRNHCPNAVLESLSPTYYTS
ncbi:hypothetical protein MK489_22640 [Myxococcota bacterium]|nr:hypothetical protein [Myxococcota bacterium]